MQRTAIFLSVLLAAGVASARLAFKLPGGIRRDSSFSCEGRPYGYYADTEFKCATYHVCEPVFDDEGVFLEMAHYTFLCGFRSIFSQDTLGCKHPGEAYPCDDAPSIYESSNAEFGIVPEVKEEVVLDSVI